MVLIRCSKDMYRIFSRHLWKNLEPPSDRKPSNFHKGINWDAVIQMSKQYKNNNQNQPFDSIEEHLKMIRDNVIIDPSSKFESHVRRYDLFQHARFIDLASKKDIEIIKEIKNYAEKLAIPYIPSLNPNDLLKSVISVEISNDCFIDVFCEPYARGEYRDKPFNKNYYIDQKPLLTPIKICTYLLQCEEVHLEVDSSEDEQEPEQENVIFEDVWYRSKRCIDIILPGWRNSVRIVSWHHVTQDVIGKYIPELSPIDNQPIMAHLVMDVPFLNGVHLRTQRPITCKTYDQCIKALFQQLEPFITKPSNSIGPFRMDLDLIKMPSNQLYNYITISALLEYAKHNVSVDTTVATEKELLQGRCCACDRYS
ncbi:uncharacterized protein L201_005357 [Kwoniella dendrophila CBS 6074]|uniref:Uncharacterized protein n=1 Tax=Kwoniella dendrophila CBS 6074 TaxID=1295534 RepID=A0AAX4JYJ4_9TREE